MTPLVLVHGFMGGAAQWASLDPTVSARVPLIALDLPGFGARAAMPPLDRIDAFADWALSELSRMGIDRYHLLGHSMGGMIAQEMARRDAPRIEKLVLYATGSIGVLPGRFETIDQSKARAVQDGPRATARRISATWFLDREEAPAFPACAAIAELAGLAAIQAGLDAMQHWSGRDALHEIPQETLVLWGDHDRTYPWEQIQLLWSGIGRTQLAVVPGCAHAVHMEKPDLFNATLLDFLAGS